MTYPRPEGTVVRPIPCYHGRAHQGANHATNVQHYPARSIPDAVYVGYQQEHVQGLCGFSGQFQFIPDQPSSNQDACLRHAHPNLDAFRLRNLHSAPISGGDLFDRSLRQEYEQHLIGLGVKTGTKKERCHPYKKKKGRGGNQRHYTPQGMFYQPMLAPQYMVQQSFYPHPQGATENVLVAAEVTAVEVTCPTLSSSNLLNDTQTNVLASSHPGQKGIIVSETLLDYFYPHTPPEGEKTLSVQSLQEKAKTPCVQSLQEREKTPCVQSLHEREKTPPVGGRLRHFLAQWEHQGAHRSILSLLRDAVKLPFREHPNLSRVPCITSGYAGSDRQSALLTSIQDLLHKDDIEVMHTQNSLGFYS